MHKMEHKCNLDVERILLKECIIPGAIVFVWYASFKFASKWGKNCKKLQTG